MRLLDNSFVCNLLLFNIASLTFFSRFLFIIIVLFIWFLGICTGAWHRGDERSASCNYSPWFFSPIVSFPFFLSFFIFVICTIWARFRRENWDLSDSIPFCTGVSFLFHESGVGRDLCLWKYFNAMTKCKNSVHLGASSSVNI